MEDEKSQKQMKQYLTFRLGNEFYGIEVDYVKEVFDYTYITKVPKTPGYISGIINLRGEVVPVIDLSSLFYKRSNEVTKFTCIVIIDMGNEKESFLIGVLIDAVNAVIDMDSELIEAAPDFGIKIRSDYVSGVGKSDGRFIILLDIFRVLDVKELSDFEKRNETGPAILYADENK